MADPMRKEVNWVRKKIDSVNKELKPLGSTVQKKVNTLFKSSCFIRLPIKYVSLPVAINSFGLYQTQTHTLMSTELVLGCYGVDKNIWVHKKSKIFRIVLLFAF